MRVLITEHIPADVRGKITKYMYEVSPNRFVGNIPKTIANKLWEMLSNEPGVEASFVEPCNNEQGFSVRSIGNPSYSVADFDGIVLFSRKPDSADFLANHSVSKSNGKTVAAHLIDVASVCEVLCTKGYFKRLIEVLCKKSNVVFDDFVQLCTWICAFHDIGKITPDFQYKITSKFCFDGKMILEKFLTSNNLLQEIPEDVRHEIVSKDYLLLHFMETERFVDTTNPRRVKIENHLKFALDVVSMHHQGKGGRSVAEDNNTWKIARDVLFEKFSKEYPYIVVNFDNEYSNVAFQLVLGIVNTSDFIASGSEFAEGNVFDLNDISAYRKEILEKAENVLQKAGFLYEEGAPLHFEDIFSDIQNPRPMQKEVMEQFDFLKNDVRFAIVEDVCGSGKTEGGLALSNAISNHSHGLFVALPTHATAAAMLPRMKDYSVRICSPYKPELLTAKARYVENPPVLDQEEMESWVYSSYYKMGFPYSTGTIDQMLRGVRREKYGLTRLFASLSRGILLDEIHSYDSYMLTIIEELLVYCRIFETPVVMMSASLDKKTKQRLVKAVSGFEYEPSNDYPLITYGTKDGVIEKKTDCWHSPYSRTYKVLPLLHDTRGIAEHVQELSETTGGCIGVVVNLVADAVLVYEYLKENLNKDTELILYHSKFCEDDKNEKTEYLLKVLGKDRTYRPKNLVVVCTQIAEQSIDIDFDIMCTQIAPVDALIQRLGRLWRHNDEGTIREKKKIETPVYIYTSPEEDFGKHSAFVYKGTVLHETNRAIVQKQSVCIPTDIRAMVDAVYGAAIVPDIGDFAVHGNLSPFEFLENRPDSWVVEPHVRRNEYPVLNLCMMTQETYHLLEENNYPKEICENILRSYTVTSVAAYKFAANEDLPKGKGLLKNHCFWVIPNEYNPKDFSYYGVSYSKEYGLQFKNS